MTVFIRDLKTWSAVGEFNATNWSIPAESSENKNGSIVLAGKIDCSGQWAIIDGRVFYVEKSSEDNGLTTLTVIKPFYAFRRSLVFSGSSSVELGNFIAGRITEEFVSQADAEYRMAYITVTESVTVNADLGLRNNEVYSFTDVFEIAEQNGVGFDFTANYDTLAIRIYQRTYSQYSLFPGDGHTFLISSNITKELVAKATVRKITVVDNTITVVSSTNYYWHKDGTISTTPPAPAVRGSWVTVSVDRDDVTLAAAAAEAMRGNVAAYKFVFRAEENMALGDYIAIRINGEVYNGVITLVNLSSDGRTYEAGSLPVTLTEKIGTSDVKVSSITYEKRAQMADVLAAYPVGSIYISVNSTSPATLFGGTWQELQGRFLLGRNSAHAAGSTGGEETHALTVNEMPTHGHEMPPWMWAVSQYFSTGNYNIPGGTTAGNATDYNTGKTLQQQNTASVGGGQAHNNMPPYLAVYMWKRTA